MVDANGFAMAQSFQSRRYIALGKSQARCIYIVGGVFIAIFYCYCCYCIFQIVFECVAPRDWGVCTVLEKISFIYRRNWIVNRFFIKYIKKIKQNVAKCCQFEIRRKSVTHQQSLIKVNTERLTNISLFYIFVNHKRCHVSSIHLECKLNPYIWGKGSHDLLYTIRDSQTFNSLSGLRMEYIYINIFEYIMASDAEIAFYVTKLNSACIHVFAQCTCTLTCNEFPHNNIRFQRQPPRRWSEYQRQSIHVTTDFHAGWLWTFFLKL